MPEFRRRWTRIAAVLLVVLTVSFLAVWTHAYVFCQPHDDYDDSGYMLAIFTRLAGGWPLYEDVFSQYGPFHAQAWLSFFRAGGFPVDHDHMALGVAWLWLGSVLFAGYLGWRVCGSVAAACIVAFWTTWMLQALAAELGHPLSLCALLIFGCLGLAAVPRPGQRAPAAVLLLAGACLAGLFFTKINLGVFQGAAVGLALVAAWSGGGRLLVLCWLACMAVPVLLLTQAWPAEARCMVLFGTAISSAMMLTAWSRTQPRRMAWKRELALWSAGFAVAAIATVTVAWFQGTSLGELWQGILARPVKFPAVFSHNLVLSPADWVMGAASAVLALPWLVLGPGTKGRPLPSWWAVVVGLVGLALLSWAVKQRTTWSVGMASLAWLPVTLLPAMDRARTAEPPAAGRMLLLMGLTTAWQSLGTYPVFGSQICIPAALNAALWTVGLVYAAGCHPAASPLARKGLLPRLAVGVPFAVLTLYMLAWTVKYRCLVYVNETPVNIDGNRMRRWPVTQAALYETLIRNLEKAPGPLFTTHGQYSLVAWAGKPLLSGRNCTFISGLLEEKEIDALLAAYRAQTEWACAVYDEGRYFGEGRHFEKIDAFVKRETRTWFRVAQYDVRLHAGQQALPLRHAAWKEGGVWKVSVNPATLAKARRWELHAPAPLESGPIDFAAIGSGTPADGVSCTTVTLPPDMAAALDRVAAGKPELCCLWFRDGAGGLLSGVAVVELAAPDGVAEHIIERQMTR